MAAIHRRSHDAIYRTLEHDADALRLTPAIHGAVDFISATAVNETDNWSVDNTPARIASTCFFVIGITLRSY